MTARISLSACIRTGLGLLLPVLLLAGCGGGGGPDPELETSIDNAVGEFLGSKVAQAAPGGGTVIVLRQLGGTEAIMESLDAYRTGLEAALGPSYSFREVGPDLSSIRPGEEKIVVEALTRGWPIRAIYNWCHADRSAVAVLSLMPAPTPSQLNAKLLRRLPPMIILEPGPRPDLKSLAESGALFGLAYPHHDERPEPGSKASVEERFDFRYDYVGR